MAEAERHQQTRPQQPSTPEAEMHPDRRQQGQDASDHEQARDEAVQASAEQGVDHVPAVELPDRQQVERGHEQPEPSGERDWMQVDRDAIRVDSEHPARESQEQNRVAELQAAGVAVERPDVGQLEADYHRRHRQNGAGPRPGGADIEDRAARGRPRSDPDERAEGPDQEQRRVGRRDEVRQRRVHPVAPRDDVVSHLVRQQDRHQGY